jgi:hypothetical protein
LPRWCRSESGALEPSLEGAFGGQGSDSLLRQVDPDQAGPPGGMIPTELDGGLEGRMGWWRIRAVVVIGYQTRLTPFTPPPQQVPDGARGEVEGLAQLRGRRSLLPTPPHGLPDG